MISNNTASVGLWRSGQHLPVYMIRPGNTVMCDLTKHSTSRTNESTQCRHKDDSAQNSCIWIGAESSKSDVKVDNGLAPLVLSSEHANAGADSQDRVCFFSFRSRCATFPFGSDV